MGNKNESKKQKEKSSERELILMEEIIALSKIENKDESEYRKDPFLYCIANPEHIADVLYMNPRKIKQTLKSLVEKKVIVKKEILHGHIWTTGYRANAETIRLSTKESSLKGKFLKIPMEHLVMLNKIISQ